MEYNLNSTICRRLLIVYLLSILTKPNIPTLVKITGWSRRTIQEILNKGLQGHGVTVFFLQAGFKNNDGLYRVKSWGSIDKTWVFNNLTHILYVLQLPLDIVRSNEDNFQMNQEKLEILIKYKKREDYGESGLIMDMVENDNISELVKSGYLGRHTRPDSSTDSVGDCVVGHFLTNKGYQVVKEIKILST